MRSTLLIPLVVVALVGCGGNATRPVVGDVKRDDAQHIHGLGLNPGDGALFIATHSGLWRAERGGRRAKRVESSWGDVKGFTVVARNRFLASGHPVQANEVPPDLGLMLSRNAGESWRPMSLYGRADLHIIRSAGSRIYAIDANNGALLSTANAGRRWRILPPPAAVVDLAVHPSTPDHLVAATDSDLRRSTDGGRTWRWIDNRTGALAWPAPNRLYVIGPNGTVATSSNAGRSFRVVGKLDQAPVAMTHGAGRLFAALENASVWESRDGGRSWRERARL
jgi:hypothetical protein